MDIKELEWLEIFLWYKCTVRCSFCYQKNLRNKFLTNINKKNVLSLIDDWYLNWKKFIIFSWWEPTLDKNLAFYIEYAKNIWYKYIRVHTNWFGFSDYDYLYDLYKKWLNWITISVHWYWIIHDNISKVKWSFNIIVKALINFERLKKIDSSFIIDTNTVICKENYKNIYKLIYLLCKFSITRGQIVLSYSLDLFDREEKKKIIPEYSFIIKYILKALDVSIYFDKKFVLENFPFCVVNKNYWNKILSNIKINKSSITLNEWNIWNTNLTWVMKTKKCNDCKIKDICRWLPKDYYEIYWDNCLKTIYD